MKKVRRNGWRSTLSAGPRLSWSQFVLHTIVCLCVLVAPLCALAENGQRKPAYSLSLAYTADLWSLVDGGEQQGTRYLDDVDLQFTADLEQAVGWRGAVAFVYLLYNNGTPFSEDLVGDLQRVSHIETGIEALRVEEAWIDQRFCDEQGSLRVGLYDLNSEFDASLVRSIFLNSSHGIGAEFAQAGLNGPSIFPVTSLAARFNWSFQRGVYTRVAVLDGVPGDPDHPKRTTIDLHGEDGALIAAEAGVARDDGTIASLGVWHFTSAFDDLTETTAAGAPRRRHGNSGLYVAAEGPLLSHDGSGALDVSGFIRFGFANDDINPISHYLGAGVVVIGPLDGRPLDKLGLALAIADVGDKYGAVTRAAGGEPAGREINLELTYQMPIADGVVLQPDLQFIHHPGADKSIPDAVVVGLRLKIDHSWRD